MMGNLTRFQRRCAALVTLVALAGGVLISSSAAALGVALLTVGVDVQNAAATTATYEVVVSNVGTSHADKIRAWSSVPAGMTFERSTPEPSAPDGGTAPACDNSGLREASGQRCDWLIGTLYPGESLTLSVTFNVLPTAAAGAQTIRFDASGLDSSAGTGTNQAMDDDNSLNKAVAVINQDTFVNSTEPTNTNHGGCATLLAKADGSITAFLDADTGLPPETDLEHLWSATLEATFSGNDYSSAAPGTLAVYPITSGNWTEGPGPCAAGIPGSGSDVRTGTTPATSPTPTSTTSVTGPGQIAWDVTSDLNASAERSAFQGWEIKNVSAAGVVNIESSEAVANKPKITVMYTKKEAASCIDVDPEFTTGKPSEERFLEAHVTDGTAVPTVAGSRSATDGCNGAPVTGERVVWKIEGVESPDAYIAHLDDFATTKTAISNNWGPNFGDTATDSSGRSRIGVRLGNEQSWIGTNRVSGRITSTDTPEPEDNGSTCSANNTCSSGESATEDDVYLDWDPDATPAPTSTSNRPSPPSPSTTTSPSSSLSPTRSPASSSSSPTGIATSRGLTPVSLEIALDRARIIAGQGSELSGQIRSETTACAQPGMSIEILAREAGDNSYEHLAYSTTSVGGTFTAPLEPSVNTVYLATIPQHDICDAAESIPQAVMVAPKISIKSTASQVVRGKRFWIAGAVTPGHQLTPVTLWRKVVEGHFEKIGRDLLDGTSRYSFALEYSWKRPTSIFIVRWRSADQDHVSGRSIRLRVDRAGADGS